MMIIIGLLILSIVLMCMVFIQTHIIPHAKPDNRFVKWWKRNIIDEDPDHL
jgi:hypothetical protein